MSFIDNIGYIIIVNFVDLRGVMHYISVLF